MHHFLRIHLSLKHVADLCIYLPLYDDDVTENDKSKVKKLTVMSIFAPVLKFDGHFYSKKFYMGILHLCDTYMWRFCTLVYK